MLRLSISGRLSDRAGFVLFYVATGQCIAGHSSHLNKQDAQLSQRDRAAGCVIVFAKSRRLELGDNILRTL